MDGIGVVYDTSKGINCIRGTTHCNEVWESGYLDGIDLLTHDGLMVTPT